MIFIIAIYDYSTKVITLLGKIMACFIVTGEIMGREKYGGIVPKPPVFSGHNFTCDFERIYSFLSIQDAFASTMINDDI